MQVIALSLRHSDKRFAKLFFLQSCCINSVPNIIWGEREKEKYYTLYSLRLHIS